MAPKELDDFIDDLLNQSGQEIAPPDQLASVTYSWHGDDFDEIRSMANELPASVIRAKGFVLEKDEVYLFSYVMGDWTIEPFARDSSEIKHQNMVVFIGGVDSMDGVAQAVAKGSWAAREVLTPTLQTNII